MNQKQKIVLTTVAAVVLGMLLYPPFHWKGPGGRVVGSGYHWIFAPPVWDVEVNIGLLITQWIAVLIVGTIAYFILKDR